MRRKVDYLGDVNEAMRRYEYYGPGMANIEAKASDQLPHRYGAILWNGFGKWSASEPTLADSIHVAIDRAVIDRFGFTERAFGALMQKRERVP